MQLEEEAASVSQQEWVARKQLVVFFGNAGIGTRGGWGAKAVLQACRKLERPNSGKPTDRVPGRVVTVDEFRTSRVSSILNSPQPCEKELDSSKPTRHEDWKPKPGQVQNRLLRSAWSKRFEAPVRGLMWCPWLAQATPGDLGKWVDRDCNAALNLERAGESKWRPLELCRWPDRGRLPAQGKEYPALGFKKLRDRAPKAQAQQPVAQSGGAWLANTARWSCRAGLADYVCPTWGPGAGSGWTSRTPEATATEQLHRLQRKIYQLDERTPPLGRLVDKPVVVQLVSESQKEDQYRRRRRQRTARTQCKAAMVAQAAGAERVKRVLITGGNTGIGFETAKSLCAKGWDVTLACRDKGRAAAAVASIKEQQPGAQVSSLNLDLANLASVKAAASSLVDTGCADFDVLLNNAGVMATPKMKTQDGFDFQARDGCMHLGVNHLGHFALTLLLLPAMLKAEKPVRIINVSSAAHTMGSIKFDDLNRDKPGAYSPWEAYGQSKLANILFTYELARRLKDYPQVTVNCLHPGVVRTELGRYMVNSSNQMWMGPAIYLASFLFKTPQQGAQTSIYLASSPDVANTTSKYFVDCKAVASSRASHDASVAARLWEYSAALTKVPADILQPAKVA
ncbi:hypothetical protein QJQ45_009959 [Haematococcus lacustris]|nr:hypothetical protein QJQ45_009959 [Haematococcus lacustris]